MVDRAIWYLRIQLSSSVNFAENWGPLSEITLLKSPNHVNSLRKTMEATPSTVILDFVGHRITPLLSPWSTTTNKVLNPLDSGSTVMRSYDICLQGRVSLEGIGVIGGMVG